jgi:FtsP/CotA-like multicopper oxidase with cupredoxin domain
MAKKKISKLCLFVLFIGVAALTATAQSFQVQCPARTITHPFHAVGVDCSKNPNAPGCNNDEPAYSGATTFTTNEQGFAAPVPETVNGAIKCQQISGGDGFATMGDGTQTYLFSFGPLSGLKDMTEGKPGTEFPNVFNTIPPANLVPLKPGDPATRDGLTANGFPSDISGFPLDTSAFNYNGAVGLVSDRDAIANGQCAAPCLDGHVDPRQIMDVGVMNGNIPAPLMAIDEDDEFFLTLTNVGMVMRPDLFEQHTVHFHGYPNASAFYDGVPDASVAINIGGSFTYYYLAPDAGTYFWHCHITPPEHLQMGMVGQIYVRPRQNRYNGDLYAGLQKQQQDLRTKCDLKEILCSNPLPAVNTSASNDGTKKYAYNDGDGSTQYDVEYPLQIHGFDPNFHFVGMTFNPEAFVDMKDKYFLLNGRSYPDTVTPGALATQSTDGVMHFSQPLPAIINIPAGGRALLRISDLDVTEFQTLASLGIPMQVIALNAKLLRDQSGNNLYYKTNSITLGGGESLDVILDASGIPAGTYYLYSPNLDHLSNDAENFGGLMTEVHVCSGSITGGNTFGNTCAN